MLDSLCYPYWVVAGNHDAKWSLRALYDRRLPRYLEAADIRIDNNGPKEAALKELEALC